MEVKTHPKADDEVVNAARYYELAQESLGDEFLQAYEAAVLAIVRDPNRWPVHEFGYRKYVLRRFPYTIRYIERNDYIYIIAVPHGSREPGYWTNRTLDDEQR